MIRLLPSDRLKLVLVPSDAADIDELIAFAHTFDGYRHWGSFERCANVANSKEHDSLDSLRTCLFFEARRWRHGGELPDDEAISYWRSLVAAIRKRVGFIETGSCTWLSDCIRKLPSDPHVPLRTPGYDGYTSQKDHWLGWLNPVAGTGSHSRLIGKDAAARLVYNRIVEPKMLLWLSEAAGVDRELTLKARVAGELAAPRATRASAVRKTVPWFRVADALLTKTSSGAA